MQLPILGKKNFLAQLIYITDINVMLLDWMSESLRVMSSQPAEISEGQASAP